jgi:S-adenosylmethionine-diacylgycerolhomoserine-N-methlytransferase
VTPAADDAQARMDRMYRHQRRFYDLTRRYYLLGRTHLLDQLAPPTGGTILEVGCGTASNIVGAGQRYPTAKLFGFDISNEMLTTARASVARRHLAPRTTLCIGDATAFDAKAMFGVTQFDRIFTSYTLSMIPDWRRVLEEMARHLAPNGAIHVVDFGDCNGLPSLARSGLYGWLERFDVTPRLDLHEALDAAAVQYRLKMTYTPLFRGYAQYAVLTKR